MTALLRNEADMIADKYEVYRVVLDYEALQDGFLDRIEDLNTTLDQIDAAGGLTRGNAQKLLTKEGGKPGKDRMHSLKRTLGWESLGKMLKGTGLALVLVVDDKRFAPLKEQLTARKRPMLRTVPSIDDQAPKETEITEEMQQKMISEHMSRLGQMGNKIGKSKGGKRRAKTMGKRARQRAAQHAARMRWKKRNQVSA